MIIDAHSHVHVPVEDHIALLDEAGVDKTVLFMSRPRARDLAALRQEMDLLHQALAGGGGAGHETAWRELDAALTAYPDRFIGFGSVPLDAPDVGALVERDVVGRGLRGIGELTPPPDQAALLEPVLRAATDHDGLPVVVHGARTHHRCRPAHPGRFGAPLPAGAARGVPARRRALDGRHRAGP
ncbi:amidohydrolase family protein [Nocardia sp. CA-128927]|uniref:amidohydrolase family protein n=1 Tax=Nocardia sp. CA-128927 TaxID=3239975 RepID=UPI003D99DF55